MPKQVPSKLDAWADELETWLTPKEEGGDGCYLKDAQARLAERGCEVSLGRICKWWQKRSAERDEAAFLAQIATGAQTMRTVEEAFAANPPAEIEAILRLLRVLIAELTVQGRKDPSKLELVTSLLKPVLERERHIAKLREIELAESKYRDHVAAQKAALEREVASAKVAGGITPETLEKIERELKLL